MSAGGGDCFRNGRAIVDSAGYADYFRSAADSREPP